MLPGAELVLKTANHIEKNPRSFTRLDECYPIYRGRWRLDAKHAVAALRTYAAQYPQAPGLPVWARMRDREAAPAQHSYGRFRARLALYPGARAPTPAS
jgi:hypothetical protein